MRIENTGDLFKKIDKKTDYIPVVSTFTNLIDLVAKCLIPIREKIEGSIPIRDKYWCHLKDKSTIRCIFLLIPGLGNILVATYDKLKKSDEKSLHLGKGTLMGLRGSNTDPDNKDSMMKAVRKEILNPFRWGSEKLRGDVELATEAITHGGGRQYKYIAEPLKKDEKLKELAASKGGALKYFNKEDRNNRRIVKMDVAECGLDLQYASKELRNDKEIVMAAVTKWGNALQFAGKDCQNDKDIVHAAFKNNPDSLRFASKQLRNDKAFLADLFKQPFRKFALRYVNKSLRRNLS